MDTELETYICQSLKNILKKKRATKKNGFSVIIIKNGIQGNLMLLLELALYLNLEQGYPG